ncbi:MAG: ABC transporter permease subunit [Bdellovibrionaceae bacterium]|nr:ABC transporter permease subunit [Pseudobdellovibrionaceae bacterium]
MFKYTLKRLLLIIPTLIGITLACFVITITAPGGPIEQKLAELRFAGAEGSQSSSSNDYGVPQEIIDNLKKQYGFDKPIPIQYLIWLKNAVTFNFGDSFIYEEPVSSLILERIPISLQFGLISFILTYLVCITLGVAMAVKKDSLFDISSSIVLIVLYSIPPLMLGILLKVFVAGRWDLFPIGDLYSDMYFEKEFWGRVLDRIHHFILPMLCYMIGSFTILTQFMKNNLLEEINKDYVKTARAKGLSKKTVYYKHALRNALVPIATSFGSIFSFFLAGSLIIEKIFNIPGIGLLAFDSTVARDYNVIMALIFIQSLLFIAGRIFSDLIYVVIDPRIDFS